MSDDERRRLYEENVRELDRMNVAAASVVKGLIMELERHGRATYIRLGNAAPRGHTVEYTLVQGDRHLVSAVATALGFRTVTDTRLEVHGA